MNSRWIKKTSNGTQMQYSPPCEMPGCVKSASISCSICHLVHYCGSTCMDAHRGDHQPSCESLKEVENKDGTSTSSATTTATATANSSAAAIISIGVPKEDPESPEYLTYLYDRIRHYSDGDCMKQLEQFVTEGHVLANLYMFAVIARGSKFSKSSPQKARDFIQQKGYIHILEAVGEDVNERFGASICFIRGIYFDNVLHDLDVSFQQFHQAAHMGHVSSMVSLGYAYAMGQGHPTDDSLAVQWYRAASDLGHGMGMSNLGGCYFFGVGVPKDPQEGVRWYKRSADLGHAFGQFNYGNCKFHGSGCAQNIEEAVRYYKYAAEQNFDGGYTNLGIIYQQGFGNVAPDEVESFKCFKKGAEYGNLDSINGLGCCYHRGFGVAKDENEAYRLWRITASQDSEWAIRQLHRASAIEYYMRKNGANVQDLTRTLDLKDTSAVINPQFLYGFEEFRKVIETPDCQMKAGFQVALLLHSLDSEISLVAIAKDIVKILVDAYEEAADARR